MSTARGLHRGTFALSIVTVGALVLAGCGTATQTPAPAASESSYAGELDVRVYADWPFVQTNAEEFMKLHPEANIKVGAIDNDTLRQSGGRLFLSNDAPDVISYTLAQDLFSQWVKAKAVLPVDDVWQANGLQQTTPESVATSSTGQDGQKYAVPLGLTIAPILYYNSKAWEQAGATIPNDKNLFGSLDEFNESLAKVKAAGLTPMAVTGGSLAPLAFNSLFPSACGDGYQAISENFTKGATASYTDPCIVKALSTFDGWVKNGYIEDGLPGQTQQSTQALFENEKAGSWLQGSWTPPVFTPSFEYDWALLPSLSAVESPLPAAPDSFLIPAKAKNPTLAKAFIGFMTEKSTLEMGMGRVPAQSGLDLDKVVKGNKLEAALAEAATSGSHNVIPIWDTVAPASVVTALHNDVVPGMVNGSMTPEQGAARLQAVVEEFRASNG
ncbi:MAG: ABC transporter substrate-binding protein [Propionicimonas sp.]|uniref:ABC transporter substrate-binding protein n=1 Tax=Propionicimonas sp. TaxID=1955623 RepID=UPI002B20CC4C|nr:ABC transporter substrate-binding protein [Propionicimonas sp.]MEA4943824.1 ABC transporter substrate-binding protein [Propionicimonas sp.]